MTPDPLAARVAALEAERLTGMPRWHIHAPQRPPQALRLIHAEADDQAAEAERRRLAALREVS